MSGSGTFTQAQINALTASISQGIVEVDYGDKRVKYASIGDMIALRDRMVREVSNQSVSGRTRPLYHPTVFVRR